jgi:hypothetical protein
LHRLHLLRVGRIAHCHRHELVAAKQIGQARQIDAPFPELGQVHQHGRVQEELRHQPQVVR